MHFWRMNGIWGKFTTKVNNNSTKNFGCSLETENTTCHSRYTKDIVSLSWKCKLFDVWILVG